jgi:hypothetical protein
LIMYCADSSLVGLFLLLVIFFYNVRK